VNVFAAVRKVLAPVGIALVGGALLYAPIAAFDGDMTVVSKAGIAGAVLVFAAWLLPRPRASGAEEAGANATPEAPPPGDRR
jgi:hypothetical protein